MRNLFFITFLFVSIWAYAQQDDGFFNTARLVIHGESPISVITQVNDNALDGMIDYAMGMTDHKTVKQLNENDAWLLTMLCFIEAERRDAKNASEFLVKLQERSEWLDTQPMSGRTGRAAGWVSAYDLLIRTHQLSVGK